MRAAEMKPRGHVLFVLAVTVIRGAGQAEEGASLSLLGGDTEPTRGTHHLQEAPTAAEGAHSQRRPRPLPRTSEFAIQRP